MTSATMERLDPPKVEWLSELSPERTHANIGAIAATRPFPITMGCWHCSGRGWLLETQMRKRESQTCGICSGTGRLTYEGRK